MEVIKNGPDPADAAAYIIIIIQYSSRDRYEIIGLLKISYSIKQPCSSVCLKKALEMHQKCLTL